MLIWSLKIPLATYEIVMETVSKWSCFSYSCFLLKPAYAILENFQAFVPTFNIPIGKWPQPPDTKSHNWGSYHDVSAKGRATKVHQLYAGTIDLVLFFFPPAEYVICTLEIHSLKDDMIMLDWIFFPNNTPVTSFYTSNLITLSLLFTFNFSLRNQLNSLEFGTSLSLPYFSLSKWLLPITWIW